MYLMQLNGVELGWILGMMINMTTIVPLPPASESLSLPVFIALIILFTAFVIISVAFFSHACKRHRLIYEVDFIRFVWKQVFKEIPNKVSVELVLVSVM